MSLITFDHRVKGIPCQIEVTYFHHQPPFNGPAHLCDSDWDCRGYIELEYNVLDKKGYKAGDWLESKIDGEEKAAIEQAALKLLTGDN
jgi:hypothetical protein